MMADPDSPFNEPRKRTLRNTILETAQQVLLSISGSENSGKEKLVQAFAESNSQSDDGTWNITLERKLKIDNEQYIVNLQLTSGIESLLGMTDSCVRTAQGCIFVYNIGSRESFEQFLPTKEYIERVKDKERFPFVMIGIGNSLDRQVSLSEARQAAENEKCKFIEVLDFKEHQIRDFFVQFVKETVNFYSRDKEASTTSGSSIAFADSQSLDHSKLPQRYIAVIGDVFTGKTSFIKQMTTNKVQNKYLSTANCSQTSWFFQDKEESVMIHFVDTPGLNPYYSRELLSQVQGLILVYSVTSKQSAEQLFQLREKVINLKGVSSLPSILLATKTDLPEKTHQVSDKEGRDFADKFGCCFFSQISLLNETENEKNLQLALSLLNQEIKKSKTSVMEEIKELEPVGVLNKTSKNLKKFKSKTFFIRDGILYCGQNDTQITPKTKKIQLSEDTVVEIIATDPSKKIFAFEVRNGSGKMFISATNEEDRNYWIDSIISNVACSALAASLIEDVVRVTLWDVLSDPDLTKSDSVESNGSPTSSNKIGDKGKQSSGRNFMKGSLGGLVRRKSGSSGSGSKLVPGTPPRPTKK